MDQMLVWYLKRLSAFLQALPLEWALGLGRCVGIFLSCIHPRREIAYVNLKAAFGSRYSARERKAIVRKHFCHLGQTAVEVLRFPKMDLNYFERYIQVEHRERYEQIVQKNQGTILITPHFGNWELSQILSAIVGKSLYVLAREQKHTKLDDFLNELRSSHGSVAIHKGGGVRDLIRELRKGGLVGVLGDLSGGRTGNIVRFFGRKTTAPQGIFEIGLRTHSTILPCFLVRLKGPHHQVFVEEPFALAQSGNEAKDIHDSVQNYYRLLETWIERYPDQWFWIYKRWKHCFTKRIVMLHDDRAGHTHQSEAIMKEFEGLKESLPHDYELELRSVPVQFRSDWHRKLFFVFAFFARPFIQGRLGCLNFFLEPNCAVTLRDLHADIIISAGSGLAPLNLLLKRENLAKSVVMMKPSFPYLARFFDLLVVPLHDAFPRHTNRTIRTLVTPSRVDEDLLQASRDQLSSNASLHSNGAGRVSVFIGGKTRSYQLNPDVFRKWLSTLKACAAEKKWELLVTTSRRTAPEISAIIKEELAGHPATKLLIIANESNIENAAYGMLALSELALITEDSISMVSDAVSAGKNVLVMQLGNGKLPKKHARFHQALEANALIQRADAANFLTQLAAFNGTRKKDTVLEQQSRLIQEALRKLL
ncbi:MAG: hypothetical protein A3C35_07665 [Omnitrophica bacterium RIFCSPHIGHO2_02_FULL_46_11]|nr:MAG: hypothetical protein A3C35_07665 [Omnitrophica bacterium RIFCSPHIGHO2_02_FULL_46_11]